MENTKVSVIMNCFNGGKYLDKAIKSVFDQRYQNWELIFWDNCSTDKSAEIFKSYSDPRLKYYYADNHTRLYEARNYAISKSVGDLIAFLDCDDYWHHNKLTKQVPLFENPKIGFVYSNYMIHDEMKNKQYQSKNKLFKGVVTSKLLENYFIGLLTLVIRKKAYNSMNEKFDKNLQIIGDLDFTVRLSENWESDFNNDVLATCRKHGENLLLKESSTNIDELIYWEKKFINKKNISQLKGFTFFKQNTIYLSIKQDIQDKKLGQGLKKIFSIKRPKLILKSFLFIIFNLRIFFVNDK